MSVSPSGVHVGFVLLVKRLLALALFAVSCFSVTAVFAQDDPPGRIGQLADFQGRAWLFDRDRQEWVPAPRNRPLTSGDRLKIDQGGRGVVRIGSTTVRIAGGSDVELQRIDDEQIRLLLQRGTTAVQIASPEVASEIEIVTAFGTFLPMSPGHYRFDQRDGETNATNWLGALNATGSAGLVIGESQQLTLRLIGGTNRLASSISAVALDPFSDWVAQDSQRETQNYAAQFVSPEMTGWEDLDRYGRWDSDPQYGALWLPSVVASGWAPYRFGNWIWVAPWGWTWVDNAPWGFAPFHYGRWVNVSGRWAWSPGQRLRRPTYAPALVTWTTRPHSPRSGHVAGPAVGWLPLAPREHYVPVYRASPNHQKNVDLSHANSGADQHTDTGRRGHGSGSEPAGTPTRSRSGPTNGSREGSKEPIADRGPAPGRSWNSGASAAPLHTPSLAPVPAIGVGAALPQTAPSYHPPVGVISPGQQNSDRPSWRGDNGRGDNRRDRSTDRDQTQNVDRTRDIGRPPQAEHAGQRALEPVPQRPMPMPIAPAATPVRPNPPVVVAPPPAPAMVPTPVPPPAPQQTRKPPPKGDKTDDNGNNNDTRRQNRTMER